MISNLRYSAEAKSKTVDGEERVIQIPPPIVLARLGPFLKVTISHPRIVQEDFQKKSKSSPSKVIKAMIDTGASGTVIKPEIAEELRLIHTGYQNVSSVQDEQKRPVYYGLIIFHWGSAKEIPMVSCPLKGSEFDCLIGRDILKHWHLTYNGPNGSIVICD
ncbi:retroviral-like aspartic protease family protein [candidate division WOR-3 bacterium]|nr:retroviral-like aspartic protease family protein [candidate division WOR-3 bacterium]